MRRILILKCQLMKSLSSIYPSNDAVSRTDCLCSKTSIQLLGHPLIEYSESKFEGSVGVCSVIRSQAGGCLRAKWETCVLRFIDQLVGNQVTTEMALSITLTAPILH